VRPASLVVGLSALSALLGEARAAEPTTKRQCLDAYTESQPLRRAGSLHKAREALVLCSRDPCPIALQSDCIGWLNEVDVAMPTLVLTAKDAEGHDVADARVQLDGEVLASHLDGRAVEVDPGDHVLRFERAGLKPEERTIVVREGEKGRVVEVQFGAPPDSAPKAVDRRDTPTSHESTGAGSVRPIPWSVFALGGVGVVAMGVFAYFGASGLSGRGDLESCKPNCGTSSVDAVDRKFWIADIALGASVLALGAATVVFLTRPTERRVAMPGHSIRVVATPRSVGLSFIVPL
jgi:hypothetical protein